jgi:hypothetical protein
MVAGPAVVLVLAPAGPVRARTVAASATDAAPAPMRIRVCRDTLPMAQREDPSVLAPLLELAGKLTFRVLSLANTQIIAVLAAVQLRLFLMSNATHI